MLTQMTILYSDNSWRSTKVELPPEPSYEQIRLAVAEGLPEPINIEHVRVLAPDGQYVSMFVDEDGIQKGLPVNPQATAEYWRNVLTHEPGTDKNGLPWIHGTAVIFDRNVWF